jgi:glycosyltransferase involved in cell wall biosynthesis
MPDNSKRKVAIVHGLLNAGNGGSEARAMWAVEALKHDFAVSLVVPGTVCLDRLNEAYGTSIKAENVRICSLPIPRILTHHNAPSGLRGAFAERALRAVLREHDVLISTYNMCNFGRPGIQCVADFSWDENLRRRFDPAPVGMRGWYHRVGLLRIAYLCLCRAIASRARRVAISSADLIVANSEWTAIQLKEMQGNPPRVVYPPVAGHVADIGEAERKNDFVCVGRIAPEKRIERMISIISAVRKLGHDVRLRIVGPLDSSRYAKTITALARQNSNWMVLEGLKVGREKERLLSACRYGIHGREGEAFGIAVAEMVKAGCITFAPAEGGPAEILRHDALLYSGHDDAVAKIAAVLERKALRSELAAHLRRQGEQFSPERFMSGLRSVVQDFLTLQRPCAASNVTSTGAFGQ